MDQSADGGQKNSRGERQKRFNTSMNSAQPWLNLTRRERSATPIASEKLTPKLVMPIKAIPEIDTTHCSSVN